MYKDRFLRPLMEVWSLVKVKWNVAHAHTGRLSFPTGEANKSF